MKDSAIEWTDHTFNPWEGCTKVSPGCVNCYAEARNQRFSGGKNWGKGAPRRRTKTWGEPVKWNRDAEKRRVMELHSVAAGEAHKFRRPRVFCASLADWLDDEVPIEWLADLLKLIHDTPNLDWLLLTKRPQNWRERIDAAGMLLAANGIFAISDFLSRWLHWNAQENIWIGTTVEDQKRADERIPELLKIPARVRFLSCEPLLEGVDLHLQHFNLATNTHGPNAGFPFVSWVIVGGESGRGKRPFKEDWGRSIRNQCRAAGVPFFMKQMDKVKAIPEDLMVRQFPNTK